MAQKDIAALSIKRQMLYTSARPVVHDFGVMKTVDYVTRVKTDTTLPLLRRPTVGGLARCVKRSIAIFSCWATVRLIEDVSDGWS
jgi:hypothetical protein